MPSFDSNAKCDQSCFRKSSETISDEGRNPTDPKGKPYRYMLALGCEYENLYPSLRGDDRARKFFSDRGLKWWRHNRFDVAGRNEPTRNMASSQIMCVNFMLPLVEIDGALTALVSVIDTDIERVVEICHENRKSRVEFEWIGNPLSLECTSSRGANSTSVDAFIIAETKSGSRRAYLMEWKYTERYSRTDYGSGRSGDTRRDRYSNLYHGESSSFNHTVPMNTLMYGEFYQLMRNRLLADRMAADRELGVSDAKVVLVIPEGNSAYLQPRYLTNRFPKLGTTVPEVFRATLKDPNRAFATVSPSTLLKAVERECGGDEKVSDWSKYMRERYGL